MMRALLRMVNLSPSTNKRSSFVRLAFIKFRVAFYTLYQFVVAFHRSIVFQYIHNKPFFDSLFHAVSVESDVFILAERLPF